MGRVLLRWRRPALRRPRDLQGRCADVRDGRDLSRRGSRRRWSRPTRRLRTSFGCSAAQMPVSAKAQIELAAAYLADGPERARDGIARPIWTEEILDASTERKVLDKLGSLLTADDHWARAVHLMMHDRASATERLFGVPDRGAEAAGAWRATRRRGRPRTARRCSMRRPRSGRAIRSTSIRAFSGRGRRGSMERRRLARQGTERLPDAAEWWYERRAIIRKLLGGGRGETRVPRGRRLHRGPRGRVVEAHFHAG